MIAGSGYRGEAASTPAARFERFLDEVHLARLDRDGELRARVGLSPRTGWPDSTGREKAIDAALTRSELSRLQGFSPAALSGDQPLSHRLLAFEANRRLERLQWLGQAYLALPGEGPTATLRARLVDGPAWTSSKEAEAWIADVSSAGPWLDAMAQRLDERADTGLLAPRSALVAVAEEGRALLAGRPIDPTSAEEGIWSRAVRDRVAGLPGVGGEAREDLTFRAEAAIAEDLGPALARWVARVEALAESSPEDSGVWSLPDGEAWYASLVRDATGLQLTPAALHELGLQEVERLHDRLRTLQERLGLEGDLPAFFRRVAEDPRWAVTDDDAGRAATADAVDRAREVIQAGMDRILVDGSTAALDADIVVGGVPAHRVHAHVARRVVPGRRLREALTRTGPNAPFRRALEVDAWAEGWDLYAASLPLDLGLVEDPYDAYGVLVEELWAACLLVADTGMHHERWSPVRARDWLTTHSAGTLEEIVAAVDDLLVHPASAVAAPVGCLRIRELRWSTRRRLGARFSLPGFHRVVLEQGPLPLSVLEERVLAWEP